MATTTTNKSQGGKVRTRKKTPCGSAYKKKKKLREGGLLAWQNLKQGPENRESDDLACKAQHSVSSEIPRTS